MRPLRSILRRRLRWTPALLPAALLIAFWLPGANQGGWRVDTGLYAAIGAYAWETGQLIHLFVGDQPYFNKPPLPFWIHGLFLHELGVELWVARLPSLLAAIACALVTARTAWLLSGPRVATLTGLVVATTLEYFRYTRAISLDLWQALWLMCALWACAAALRRGRPGLLASAGAPLGLALLTKPLVALGAIPLLALWLIWIGRARWLHWLGGAALVALAIAAPWHLEMMRAYPDAFAPHYFGKQSLERAIGESYAEEPWWAYLSKLARFYWPWLPAAALGVGGALIRPPLDERKLAPAAGAAERLCLVWVIGWLLTLSVVAGKSGRYAIHIYPCLAWLSAIWLARHSPRPVTLFVRAAERWFAPSALLVAAAMAVMDVRVHAPARKHWQELPAALAAANATTVWASPESGARWTTCNVYLETGAWPRTARISAESLAASGTLDIGVGGDPQPGELMIFSAGGKMLPRPQDEVVWQSGDLTLVRITGEWDGALPPNPAR